MTSSQSALLVSALEEKCPGDRASYRIEVQHDFAGETYTFQGYWEVILVPLIHAIFLLPEICTVITDLDIHVAICTHRSRPGCIIIH